MSEQLGFVDRLRQSRDRLLGRRVLEATDGQTMVDAELRVAYQGRLFDPSTGQILDSDDQLSWSGRRIEQADGQDYHDNGWEVEPSRSDDPDYRWAGQISAVPVIVDEYGIETGYELSSDQIDQLDEVIGEFMSVLGMRAVFYNHDLAREGLAAIDSPTFSDEREIARLFAESDRGYTSKENINRGLVDICEPGYYADREVPSVKIGEKHEYIEQQRQLNQSVSGDKEAMK